MAKPSDLQLGDTIFQSDSVSIEGLHQSRQAEE